MNDDREYSDVRTTDVDRSPGRSLIVLGKIAGKWWFSFWILTLLGGLVSFSLTVANIKQFSPVVWGTLLIVGFVFAPIVASHYLRIQRDKFKAFWDDKEVIIKMLNQIEEARAEAAALQIEGMSFTDEEQLAQWIEKVNTWQSITYEKVYKLHPAEAGNFNTLGLFAEELARGTQLLNTEH